MSELDELRQKIARLRPYHIAAIDRAILGCEANARRAVKAEGGDPWAGLQWGEEAEMLAEVKSILEVMRPDLKNCHNCHHCLEGHLVEFSGGVFVPAASTRMILCPVCGNKRCPKASNHNLDCTGSNEPGQPGSIYK